MGPRPFGRGRKQKQKKSVKAEWLQWGRDLSAAEGTALGCGGRGGGAASMGPRPFGRGRHATPMDNPIMLMGFNGAATFRPRKDGIPAARQVCFQRLQWGRDLSAAEGCRPPRPNRAPIASMGPRPFGRGRRRRYCRPNPNGRRFNGAATFRPRKGRRRRMRRRTAGASMGPRPFGRGRAMDDLANGFDL